MSDLCTDIGYKSLNKFGEQLCGDMVEVIKQEPESYVVVLADGLGSGVKASILSTLTSKIISTMLANGIELEECVRTLADTLPVCDVRKIAYSTFSVIKITDNKEAELIQYDNPRVILLRDGKNFNYEEKEELFDGKKIYKSKIGLKKDDIFVMISDGAVHAGVGKSLNYGWERKNIIEYLEGIYNKELSAKGITNILLEECNGLYAGEPGDDTTVCAIKIRKRKPVSLLIGPPKNPEDDKPLMKEFFGKDGKKIVCGGTTSKIVSTYLDKELVTEINYVNPEIPPTGSIEGVDLVTEGVITISKVLEYAKDFLAENVHYSSWTTSMDGASKISRLLFEEATDIDFYIGRAMNSAHQNPDLPINFNIKMRLIDELATCLTSMGKRIHLKYY